MSEISILFRKNVYWVRAKRLHFWSRAMLILIQKWRRGRAPKTAPVANL